MNGFSNLGRQAVPLSATRGFLNQYLASQKMQFEMDKYEEDLKDRRIARQYQQSILGMLKPREELIKAQTDLARLKGEQLEKMPDFNELLGGEEGAGTRDYETGYSFGPTGPTISFKQKPKLPSESIFRVSVFKDLRDIAGQAKGLYDKKYVGPIGATIGKIRQTTGIGASAEETAFRMKIESLVRRAYAESGKQISVREMEILKQFTPHLSMPATVFEAAMETFEQELKSRIEANLDIAEKAGYKVPQLFDREPTQDKRIMLEKSPYPEYPDAYKENDIWYVIQNGKRYRIED